MAIVFSCHDCGKKFSRPDGDAGRFGKCPCGAIVHVPTAAAVRTRTTASEPVARRTQSLTIAIGGAMILAVGVSFFAGTQIGTRASGRFDSSIDDPQTEVPDVAHRLTAVRRGKAPPLHTPGVRPPLHAVWDRLEYGTRCEWRLVDVIELSDGPHDGELSLVMQGWPVLLAIDGPRDAVERLSVTVGPIDTTPPSEHAAVRAAIESLSAAAGLAKSEVLAWVNANEARLDAGEPGVPIDTARCRIWGFGSSDQDGSELTIGVSIDIEKPAEPPFGIAKLKHQVATAPWWEHDGDNRIRHATGVVVSFGEDEGGVYARLMYDPRSVKQSELFSSAISFLIPGIGGNGEDLFDENNRRLRSWLEEPSETLRLIGGTVKADSLEDRYLVLTVREN